jgi:DnaJ-class molecular chaperone
MDYYSTLGLQRGASDADIKKAYRSLAMKHHPDRGGDADTFKNISVAYDTLSDENKRAQYDQQLMGGPQINMHNFGDINEMFGMKKIFQMYLNNIIFYKTNPY